MEKLQKQRCRITRTPGRYFIIGYRWARHIASLILFPGKIRWAEFWSQVWTASNQGSVKEERNRRVMYLFMFGVQKKRGMKRYLYIIGTYSRYKGYNVFRYLFFSMFILKWGSTFLKWLMKIWHLFILLMYLITVWEIESRKHCCCWWRQNPDWIKQEVLQKSLNRRFWQISSCVWSSRISN